MLISVARCQHDTEHLYSCRAQHNGMPSNSGSSCGRPRLDNRKLQILPRSCSAQAHRWAVEAASSSRQSTNQTRR